MRFDNDRFWFIKDFLKDLFAGLLMIFLFLFFSAILLGGCTVFETNYTRTERVCTACCEKELQDASIVDVSACADVCVSVASSVSNRWTVEEKVAENCEVLVEAARRSLRWEYR